MTFRDAHTHLSSGAMDLADLDLRGLDADGALVEVVREVSRRPAGRWIGGWGWHGDPTAKIETLDRATPAHPVVLARADGHGAWLNLAARRVLGCAVPIVTEHDYDRLRPRLPRPTREDRMIAVARRAKAFADDGVAAVDDIVESWAIGVYNELAERSELPLSVTMWTPDSLRTSAKEAYDAYATHAPLAFAGIKIFVDGTLGARTAALFEPYADDPETSGRLRSDPDDLNARVKELAGRGYRVALHAIGDRAVDAALSALERAPKSPAGPHRIEHAQVVRERDLPRFAAAGIVASVQPRHFFDDAAFREARLGARDGVISYPLASLARAGATLLFGSDWPVSDHSPRAILRAATDPDRGEEALGEAEALAAMTA
ncbi:MAG TPA: amidohydrolase family protein [Candidatus Polarisedimenticolaceae bacterium]|nr:amidohydrolase family protein [Candidatus Polarisedimenticolaceae bacterium]